MTFLLSPEHEALRAAVREFAQAEIGPYAAEWDEAHHFPVEIVGKMGDLGLIGAIFDEEYGGAAGDFTSLCVAVEEIGRVDQSMGITLEAAVGLGINPIAAFGSAAQKAQWLPDLIAGRTLAAFGLTEPGGGSDAGGAIRTRAVRDGDEWVIDGSKAFITNSGTEITALITVAALTGDNEISTFIVPTGTPGLTVEPAYHKLGWHASDTHGLGFENCRIPAENMLGEQGRGFHQFLATLDDGRIAIAALAVGLIQACLDLAVDYAGSRHAFGRPIGSNQGVAFRLADLDVALEGARLLTYKAAALRDADQPIKQAAARAKLFATEAAVSATRVLTQVMGGYGFIEGGPAARFYRDAKILEIGEGTSEIQRLLLARALGLPVR